MYQTTSQNAAANFATLLDMAIIEKQPVAISTANGRALLVSEDDFSAIIETNYLCSNPKTKQTLIAGLAIPLSECEELRWENI